MKYFKKNFFKTLIALLPFFPLMTFAQDPSGVEMADKFREDGKIYVVIAIISLILLGLIIYLVMIDRNVSKLEKRIKKDK